MHMQLPRKTDTSRSSVKGKERMISVTRGSYRWTAVRVGEASVPKPWLCREFFNVGLETESEGNRYIASNVQVMNMFNELFLGMIIQ